MRDWTLYADDFLNACDIIGNYITGLSYESLLKIPGHFYVFTLIIARDNLGVSHIPYGLTNR
jgi:hypothetical protein